MLNSLEQVNSLPTKETQEENIIENSELNIAYKEKIIVLPEHRQNETGIKRIRKRIITNLPPCFGENFPYIKGYEIYDGSKISYDDLVNCLKCFKFLTNGRFPSPKTWSHEFMADYGPPGWKTTREALDKFKDESLYFQRIRRIFRGEIKAPGGTQHLPAYNAVTENGNLWTLSAESNPDMSYACSWLSGNPTFAFGAKNQAFVDYINSVIQHPESRKMFDSLRNGKKGSMLGPEKNIEFLKRLIENKDTEHENHRHPFIPVVEHPDIKPLRWCHAESAIITTKKGLNVLIFETD